MEFENYSTQASIYSYLWLMHVLNKKHLIDILYQERRRERNSSSIVFGCWANFARPLAETKISPKSSWSHVLFVVLCIFCWLGIILIYNLFLQLNQITYTYHKFLFGGSTQQTIAVSVAPPFSLYCTYILACPSKPIIFFESAQNGK